MNGAYAYKSNLTYQEAMRRLGAFHTRALLKKESDKATPLPVNNGYTASQRARVMEGRWIAQTLLHPEEAESQARPREAAPQAQASVPQIGVHISPTVQGLSSIPTMVTMIGIGGDRKKGTVTGF